MSRHSVLTDAHLHRPGYYQADDPGAIGSGKAWVDTTTTPYELKIRNAADDGWVGLSGDITGVTAGAGLTGGGTSGAVTLDVIGTADRITVAADSINIASTYVGQASITTVGTLTSITATGLLQVTLTSEQARLRYSATEYQSITVGATGTTAFAKTTAGTKLYTFDAAVTITGQLTASGARHQLRRDINSGSEGSGADYPFVVWNQDATAVTLHFVGFYGVLAGTDGVPYNAGMFGWKKEQEWTSTASTRDSAFYLDVVVNGSVARALDIASNKNATFAARVAATNFAVSGTQVLGAQGAAIADADGTLADITTKFNALLARNRTHGLIAT